MGKTWVLGFAASMAVVGVLMACGRSEPASERQAAFRSVPTCDNDSECGKGAYCWRPFAPEVGPVGSGQCLSFVALGELCVDNGAIYRCATGLSCNLSTRRCERAPGGMTPIPSPIPVTPIATMTAN